MSAGTEADASGRIEALRSAATSGADPRPGPPRGAALRARLQRTLFRMQLDPGFARRLLAREPAALASSGLDEGALALLLAADPRAIAADPGGRRRLQVLGNASSEFRATLAAGAHGVSADAFLAPFARSDELHGALAQGEPLPLAFGAWAVREARARGDRLLGALAALELALARLRRCPVERSAGGPDAPDAGAAAGAAPGADRLAGAPLGTLALSARAAVLTLPAGTHAAAAALLATLAEDARAAGAPPTRPALGPGEERLLLLAAPRPSPLRLAEVSAEPLAPPADALFARLAAGPLGADERAGFARAHGAAPADLEGFLAAFAREGALVAAPG